MTTVVLLALQASLALTPQPPRPWDARDRRAAGVALTGIAADCATTIGALNRGAVERNPLLSQRPGTLHTVLACTLGAGATVAIADALPRPWRRRVLLGVGVVGVVNGLWNLRQGRR